MEPFLKPLSAQEEKSCLDAYQRGDTKARDILVERNLRLEISLYEPIGTDKEGNEIHLLDIVEGGGEDIAEQYNRKEDAVRLYCYLDSELKEQEKQVLLLRYGLGGKAEYTQKQVAARLGISRSYVSRIEKNAIGLPLRKCLTFQTDCFYNKG